MSPREPAPSADHPAATDAPSSPTHRGPDWRRQRPTIVLCGVTALALMAGYVHVLERAVADGPARQQAAFEAAATHDREMDRRAVDPWAGRPLDDVDYDVTRNRLFDTFTLPRAVAVSL